MFYEVTIDSFATSDLANILQEAVKNQTRLIKDAIYKYKEYPNSRPKEVIALHAAAICAAMAPTTDSSSFEKKHEIRKLIKTMTETDSQWCASYLTELLTEKIEIHN